jgi:hypothetical protein
MAEEKQKGAMMQSAVREETLFTIQVDKTAFDMRYERSMLMLDSLTPHQAKALKECMCDRGSAGCGKTYVVMHLMLRVLVADSQAHILHFPAFSLCSLACLLLDNTARLSFHVS